MYRHQNRTFSWANHYDKNLNTSGQKKKKKGDDDDDDDSDTDDDNEMDLLAKSGSFVSRKKGFLLIHSLKYLFLFIYLL